MTLIIDRFEGEYAVCEKEDGEMINIAKIYIPKNANEGDVLIEKDGKYVIDFAKTEAIKKEIRDLQNQLFK